MIKPKSLSYYHIAGEAAITRPRLEQAIAVDVAIVGGGTTGLSAALTLASRGYQVAVLETGFVGIGAAGRAGGLVLPGFALGISSLISEYGTEQSRRLWTFSLDAVALVVDLIKRYDIECDLTRGHVSTAIRVKHVKSFQNELKLLAGDFDYHKLEFWPKSQLRAIIASPRYIAGLYDDGAYHLEPFQYVQGLAVAAEAAGAVIYENSRAREILPNPPMSGNVQLRTAKGLVTAKHVLIAGNAYLGRIAPLISRTIMPVASAMIATEPLGADRLANLMTRRLAVSDANFVLDYFRSDASTRLLFGGRANYNGRLPRDIAHALRPRLARVFPSLADVRIEYGWGGLIAITDNRMLQLGRIAPNIFYAQGYSGHGLALSTLAGQLMAEAIAGTAERFDVFASLKHWPFPGGAIRTPLLMLGMLYYRLRDLL